MARIEAQIAVEDKASGPIGRMSQAARRLSGDMGEAQSAADRMSAAASGIQVGPMNRLKNAISSMTDSARTAGSALANIKNIAAGNFLANAAMQAVESIRAGAATLIKLSDEMAGIHARINLVSSSAAQAAEMNNLIYASAMRSRGAYDQMAKSVATVAMTAKNVFPDPRQTVPFMEGIQKLFAIGGTGRQQQGDALLQLTQALGKGNLQGDEFRSISEAAPLIEQMVSKEMGVTQGQLKDLASKGLVTADILRDAILNNMDEINEKFSKMPMTWEGAMAQMKNTALMAFQPLFDVISNIANSKAMVGLMQGITAILPEIGAVAGTIVNIVAQMGGAVYEVISGIGGFVGEVIDYIGGLITEWAPVIVGALTAVAVGWELANVPMQIHAAIAFATAAKDILLAGAELVLTGVTHGLAGAVRILDAALLANPIMWVIGLVALAIGAWVAWSTATNGLANTIGNAFAAIAGAAGTAVNIVISAVNALIGACNGAADAINGVFGTDIGHLTEIQQVNVEGWKQGAFNVGSGMVESIQNIGVSPVSVPDSDLQYGGAFPSTDIGGMAGDNLGDMAKSGRDTAGNTGRIADQIDALDEDLKFLRETAEIDAINKYTTANIHIDLGGVNNTINNGEDVDGMVDKIVDRLQEAVVSGAEAVH